MNNINIEKKWIDGLRKEFKGLTFKYDLYIDYYNWNHDHCENCMVEISKNKQNTTRGGYHTLDGYHWFCSKCFSQYKDLLGLIEYNPNTIMSKYTNVLDMLDKELPKYDNKTMYDLKRIKGIFEYNSDIDFRPVDVKITPYIYDYSKQIISNPFVDKIQTKKRFNFTHLKEISNYYDEDIDLHKEIDSSNGWKSILLLFEEL